MRLRCTRTATHATKCRRARIARWCVTGTLSAWRWRVPMLVLVAPPNPFQFSEELKLFEQLDGGQRQHKAAMRRLRLLDYST
jgi:hypothetical protein